MYDFTVLKQAGITPGLTAKLVDVSRVTASQWCNGHAKPHRLLEKRVTNYLRLVKLAVDQKLLPLNPHPGRKLLLVETAKVIRQVATTPAPAPEVL